MVKTEQTVKLYDKDSHMKAFESVVVSSSAAENGFETVLRETAFFPEGGGQPADTGYIGNSRVFDVRIKDGVIYHRTEQQFEPGEKVTCALDWEQRFRRMQNHTGEHIISGLVNKFYGYTNVGFHMGSEDVTVDFDGVLDAEQLGEIELLANKAVWENVSVRAYYPTPSSLKRLKYRSKLDLEKDVRIVTVTGYDRCACCAPHVSRTGEIGLIKILGFMHYKGGIRVRMLCGMDALADCNTKYANVAKISELLSAKQHETALAVERVCSELDDKKLELAKTKRRIAEIKLEQLEKTDGNICIFESSFTSETMREVVNEGMKLCGGVCAAFSGSDENGYNYVIGSESVDMKSAAKAINEALSGRGGGRNPMIQGSVKAGRAEIEKFFAGAKL